MEIASKKMSHISYNDLGMGLTVFDSIPLSPIFLCFQMSLGANLGSDVIFPFLKLTVLL